MARINQLQEYETITITDDGEVKNYNKQTVTSYKLAQEPPYVKMYVDTILYLKKLPKVYNPILFCILKRLPWANEDQRIPINAALKRDMAKTLKCSVSKINNALTELVKSNVLKREDIGYYSVNPNLFGRGEWKDISRLRLEVTFDNKGKTIKGTIEHNESNTPARKDKIFERVDNETQNVS
jgi:hypothetical protein